MSHFLETVSGFIERVTFHNEETGFCVLKLKVKGHNDLVVVVGSLASVRSGEWIEAQGTWIQDRQYGQQFKAQNLQLKPPTSLEGIEKYLASGLIKGIGPVYAKMLVHAFKQEVFEIIEHSPEALQTVPGIGPQRQEQIIKSWTDQKAIRSIMLFLHSHGISTTRAVRIYKTYGNEAISLIKSNPYRLAQEIRGIGFVGADKIALAIGIEKESLLRARAGLNYTLSKATEEGHCGLPLTLLLETAQELLGIEGDVLQQALSLELQEGTLKQGFVNETPCAFLASLYKAEQEIAHRLKNLYSLPLPWQPIDHDKAIHWAEQHTKIQLSISQKQALATVLESKVTIITGGPGVGKTTLLRSLLHLLADHNMRLSLCAPTGRAAKRMMEATGFEAKTIHRLLNINPETGTFVYNEEHPLDADVIVVDEVSMMDVPLMQALLKAVPSRAALILVGDPDQLPSVGPGQVLTDLISSQTIPFIHLTETFRQGPSSQIISVAQQINKGILPPLHYGPDSDFFFLEEQDPEQALRTIIDLVQRRLPQKYAYSPLTDIQVLCPMTRGFVGSKTLNTELQLALNPPNEQSIQKFGAWYTMGDKVMQIENNYTKEVYNGDIGFITHIDQEEGEVTIDFEGRSILYDINELDEITLAYAMTIHKSQGSEYPVIIIPLMTQHYTMLQKNLVYTGITRGKKLVILVGQKKALSIAVHNKQAKKRWSMLKGNLKEKTSF